MIQSDGCRFINNRGRSDTLDSPAIRVRKCLDRRHEHLLHRLRQGGAAWTAAFPTDERKAVTIYVSRKDDVARMDEFIGPKA